MPQEIIFKADRVKVSGPKVDESFSVTFETGEYEKTSLADLFLIETGKVLEVKVKVCD